MNLKWNVLKVSGTKQLSGNEFHTGMIQCMKCELRTNILAGDTKIL